MAASLAACGDEESSDANDRPGTYEVRVTEASFPTEQRLGQTVLLKLGVRNTGDETVPNLVVTIGVGGEHGAGAALPFAVSDQQEGLSQADRPVWVLSATYPRREGSDAAGGTSTSNPKTFAFGPLKAGETTSAVWKLSAVKAGKFTLGYRIGAGLGAETKAKTAGGVAPGGSFTTEISSVPPDVEVTDDGEVVEKADQSRRGGE